MVDLRGRRMGKRSQGEVLIRLAVGVYGPALIICIHATEKAFNISNIENGTKSKVTFLSTICIWGFNGSWNRALISKTGNMHGYFYYF